MTKAAPARPEPTRNVDTGHDSYLWPRSKTPVKDELYAYLHLQGWRFDSTTMLWHTPERQTHQAFGRLEYTSDLLFATIQPPNQANAMVRESPILRLRYQQFVQGWGWTQDTTKED